MDNANRQDTLNHKIEPKESFGVTLKRERELRSIPLEDVALATNIQIEYLKALEDDNYEFLPHLTFVKGFIRSYARYIGLNPDNVMANFEHFMAFSPKDDTHEESIELGNKKNKWVLIVVVSCTFIILALLGYYLMVSMQTFKEPKITTDQVQSLPPSDFETPPDNHQATLDLTNSQGGPPLPPTINPDLKNSVQHE